jgi:hypothetical protein
MRVHYTPKPTAPEQIADYERNAAPGDQGLRACALLAEVIGKLGVKVEVCVNE